MRNLNIRRVWNLVRLAAFRLVEAGLENKPGIESESGTSPHNYMLILLFLRALIHVLQLASKTGTILCGAFRFNTSSFHIISLLLIL